MNEAIAALKRAMKDTYAISRYVTMHSRNYENPAWQYADAKIKGLKKAMKKGKNE